MLCGLQVTCTYVCKIINRQCISFSYPPSSLCCSCSLHLPYLHCKNECKISSYALSSELQSHSVCTSIPEKKPHLIYYNLCPSFLLKKMLLFHSKSPSFNENVLYIEYTRLGPVSGSICSAGVSLSCSATVHLLCSPFKQKENLPIMFN